MAKASKGNGGRKFIKRPLVEYIERVLDRTETHVGAPLSRATIADVRIELDSVDLDEMTTDEFASFTDVDLGLEAYERVYGDDMPLRWIRDLEALGELESTNTDHWYFVAKRNYDAAEKKLAAKKAKGSR